MTPEEAVQLVQKKFPFEGYIESSSAACIDIAKTVLRYLNPGDRVLDFGSGPCDKTAVIQMLGFECSAYDDLRDDWHLLGGNRDKIITFAKDCGIDFKLAGSDALPFEKASFDVLVMLDVLEHLHNSPRYLLNDLLELVKPTGYFFATVPNAVNVRKRIAVLFGKTNYPSFESYYWFPGSWRGHIREYTKGDLVKLCKCLNLDVIELRSCHHLLKKLPKVVRPVYIAITGVFTGLRDSWLLVARKKPGWVSGKTLTPDELKQILGRVTAYKY